MKTNEIVSGIFAGIGVILLFIVLVAIFLVVIYGLGYSVGWVLHLMVGPEIVMGMAFEQFIGIIFVSGTIIASGISSASSKEKDQLKKLVEQVKSYRGY